MVISKPNLDFFQIRSHHECVYLFESHSVLLNSDEDQIVKMFKFVLTKSESLKNEKCIFVEQSQTMDLACFQILNLIRRRTTLHRSTVIFVRNRVVKQNYFFIGIFQEISNP